MLLARRRRARPRDVPCTGASARHPRPARGVPKRRRAGVRRRVRGGPDTESLHALQRVVPLRRTRRVRRAGRRGRSLDRSLRAPRGARRDAPRRARRGSCEGPVVHARDDRSCALRPGRLPAGRDHQGRRPGRSRRGRARRGPATGEPGGLLPRRRRLPGVSRAPRRRIDTREHRRRDRDASVDPTTGSGGSRRASGAGSASPRRSRSTSCAPIHARTPSSSGRAARWVHAV